MSRLNYSKFGERWGLTGQYVGRLARQGRLPTINGKIDVEKADKIIEQSNIKTAFDRPLSKYELEFKNKCLFQFAIKLNY